jgi:hypothetical protein
MGDMHREQQMYLHHQQQQQHHHQQQVHEAPTLPLSTSKLSAMRTEVKADPQGANVNESLEGEGKKKTKVKKKGSGAG